MSISFQWQMKRHLPSNLSVEPELLSQFSDVAGQRKDNIVEITNPKRQFEESAFQGGMGQQKGRLDSLLHGTPLSTFFPGLGSGILESFRTTNGHPGMPTALPNRQPAANFTTPIIRVVKPYTSTLDAISCLEIAIEYKDDPDKMDTFVAPNVGRLQSKPMCILNPSTFNHAIFNKQMYDAKRDYEEYCLKTPWCYWKDWTIGGVCESEQMFDGSESNITSGFSGNSHTQQSGGYKIITVVSKGPQFLFNYFGSNIKPGGKCYAIVKKHNMPSEYYLDNKPSIASLSGRHAVNRTPLINNVPHVIKPYQMSFVCLPNGGKLPREATMYRDERGILRRDGIAIYLGTIFSVPIDHNFKAISSMYEIDPITKRVTDSRGHPHTDAREGAQTNEIMWMRLILDCDDGIGCC